MRKNSYDIVYNFSLTQMIYGEQKNTLTMTQKVLGVPIKHIII